MESFNKNIWGENKIYNQYIKDIKKYPLLDRESEVKLLKLAAKGHKKAIDKLVVSNLKFVINIAMMYKGQGLSIPELINEGNIGLLEAAKRFDPERKIKFISYAVWWIRQGITRAISEKARLVRISAEKELVLRRFNKQSSQLKQVIGGDFVIDSDEIAGKSDYTSHKVDNILKMGLRHASLDTPIGEDKDSSMLDLTESNLEPTDQMASEASDAVLISKLLDNLNEQEKSVISMYFGLQDSFSLNLQEIGQSIGLSKERVRQVKEKALSKLRDLGLAKELTYSFQ